MLSKSCSLYVQGSDAQNAASSEEKEIEVRDFESDLELHRNTCSEIKQMMEDIRRAKENGESVSTENFSGKLNKLF